MGDSLREVLARLEIKVDGIDKAKQADKAVDGFSKKAATLGKALATGLIASKIKDWAGELIDSGSALADTSAKLGVNTNNLQAWQHIAKLNGVEAGTLSASLKKLQINSAEAAANGATTGGVFKDLGVNLRDSKGAMRDTTDILYDTGIAISKLPSPAEKTNALVKTLGKAGGDLGPLFEQGAEGLDKALKEVKRLGGGLSGDAIAALDDLGDQTDRAKLAFTALEGKLAAALLPTLTKGLTKITDWSAAFFQTSTGAQVLQSTLAGVGVVGGAIAADFLLAWAPAIAGFVAMVLIIDEIKTTLEGGDSLLSRWLGPEAVKTLRKELQQLADDIKRLSKLGLKGTFDELGDVKYQSEKTAGQRAKAGAASGYLSQEEQKQFGGLDDATKNLLGFAKESIVAGNESRFGRLTTIKQLEGPHKVEDVSNKAAFELVDTLKSAGVTKAPDTQGEALDFVSKAFAMSGTATAPAANADGKPDIGSQTNTVNSTSNITINGASGSPDDIENSVRSATNDSNRAALAALSGATP